MATSETAESVLLLMISMTEREKGLFFQNEWLGKILASMATKKQRRTLIKELEQLPKRAVSKKAFVKAMYQRVPAAVADEDSDDESSTSEESSEASVVTISSGSDDSATDEADNAARGTAEEPIKIEDSDSGDVVPERTDEAAEGTAGAPIKIESSNPEDTVMEEAEKAAEGTAEAPIKIEGSYPEDLAMEEAQKAAEGTAEAPIEIESSDAEDVGMEAVEQVVQGSAEVPVKIETSDPDNLAMKGAEKATEAGVEFQERGFVCFAEYTDDSLILDDDLYANRNTDDTRTPIETVARPDSDGMNLHSGTSMLAESDDEVYRYAMAARYSTENEESVRKNLRAAKVELLSWDFVKSLSDIRSKLHSWTRMHGAISDTIKVDSEIRQQVAHLAISETYGRWTDSMQAYTMLKVANLINSSRRSNDERSRAENDTKAHIYDQYVMAEFPTLEEYTLATQNPREIQRRKDIWKRRKACGERIGHLVDRFGEVVILFFPITYSCKTISRWSLSKTRIVVKLLEQSPDVLLLQGASEIVGNIFETILSNPAEASVLSQRISREIPGVMRTNLDRRIQRPDLDPIHSFLRLLPKVKSDSSMAAALPNERDLASLEMNGLITDSVIKFELDREVRASGSIMVTDPCLASASVGAIADWKIGEAIKTILMPIHHPGMCHWTLAVINIDEGAVTLMDSLNSQDYEEAATDRLQVFLRAAAKDQDRLDKAWTFRQASVAHQSGMNCGVHVIENAKAIIRGEALPKEIDAVALRRMYALHIFDQALAAWAAEEVMVEDTAEMDDEEVQMVN